MCRICFIWFIWSREHFGSLGVKSLSLTTRALLNSFTCLVCHHVKSGMNKMTRGQVSTFNNLVGLVCWLYLAFLVFLDTLFTMWMEVSPYRAKIEFILNWKCRLRYEASEAREASPGIFLVWSVYTFGFLWFVGTLFYPNLLLKAWSILRDLFPLNADYSLWWTRAPPANPE